MDTPGESIFQGIDGLKVNSALEREQEQEALDEQRRRNEELANILQNAFDDLEEDETTMDSMNYQEEGQTEEQNDKQTHLNRNMLLELQNHQTVLPRSVAHQSPHQMVAFAQNNNNNSQKNHENCNGVDAEAYRNDIHKLKMLLESRTNELENIKQLANNESHKNDELQKRLMITEAELNRALTAKNNTHELLVESKEKYSNLENTISKIRAEKKDLEAENNTLLGKLETTRTLLADVQQKYDMVERDLNKHNERNVEMKLKQMEDRHRAEIEILHQQREQISNKLDKKCTEHEQLSIRYQSLQQSHESMQIDKATKINDLNHALCESQRRVEELLNRPDYHQENMRLQKLVASLQTQILSMDGTITKLQERVDQTTAELDVMDSVLHQHNLDDTPKRLSLTQGRVVGSTPFDPMDRMTNLKDELYRALANVKNKRDEIRKMQEQLDRKNAEIKILRDEENKALVQITTLKEENIRLENRLKVIEDEYNEKCSNEAEAEAKQLLNNKMQKLTDELEDKRKQTSVLMQEKTELESELTAIKAEHSKCESQLRNVEVDLEEIKQECENMKRNNEELRMENQVLSKRQSVDNLHVELERHKFLLKDAQAECDRLKKLYTDICGEKENIMYKMEKLKKSDNVKELVEHREKVANMQRALQLAEVKSSELTKMLDNEKLRHERELQAFREKHEKERIGSELKAAKDNANNCGKCIEYIAEVTQFEIANLKLNNMNASQQSVIDELQREVDISKDLIADLKSQMKLSEHQEELIKQLKEKAKKFEHFMQTQCSPSDSLRRAQTSSPAHVQQQDQQSGQDKIEQRSVSVQTTPKSVDKAGATSSHTLPRRSGLRPGETRPANTSRPSGQPTYRQSGQDKIEQHSVSVQTTPKSVDKAVVTSSELNQSDRRQIEARIRDEMAKIFASEIKRYQTNLRQIEDKNNCIQKEFAILAKEMEQREHDVEVLKSAILLERQNFVDMLKQKDTDCQEVVQKHIAMLQRCRDELKAKNQCIANISKELEERQTQIEAERKSMKVVMTQWEAQCKSVNDIDSEWRSKLEELKQIHQAAIESWHTKYNSAKRTAANYKRYAEDKEAHMLKEYDRLKLEYDTSLTKIELKMRETLAQPTQEINTITSTTENKPTSKQQPIESIVPAAENKSAKPLKEKRTKNDKQDEDDDKENKMDN